VNGNNVVYNLRAETITWDTAKRQWKIETVIERTINGLKEQVNSIPSMYVKLGYRPYEISDDEYLKDKLKTPALNRLIKQEERRGSENVNVFKYERYRRDSQAVAVIIMTMIGAVLASRKIRGGSGFHLAAAFVIGVLFEVTNRFSMVFSTKGNLPPILAAWMPDVLFALIAYWLYRRSPK
jgi:lipopolysaccharide export system permease protein